MLFAALAARDPKHDEHDDTCKRGSNRGSNRGATAVKLLRTQLVLWLYLHKRRLDEHKQNERRHKHRHECNGEVERGVVIPQFGASRWRRR